MVGGDHSQTCRDNWPNWLIQPPHRNDDRRTRYFPGGRVFFAVSSPVEFSTMHAYYHGRIVHIIAATMMAVPHSHSQNHSVTRYQVVTNALSVSAPYGIKEKQMKSEVLSLKKIGYGMELAVFSDNVMLYDVNAVFWHSAGFIGTMFWSSTWIRSDPCMIVGRSNALAGKFRPWVLLYAWNRQQPGLAADLSMNGKWLYLNATYLPLYRR